MMSIQPLNWFYGSRQRIVRHIFRTEREELVWLENHLKYRCRVNCYTVRELIKRGMIKSKQIIKHGLFEIESSELEKDIVKKVVGQLKAGQSLRSMGV